MGYWDIPEGTDCPQKLWITTKLAATLGLVGSAYGVVIHPPDSTLEGIKRTTMTTVTMASMGAIFGMVTCLSAYAREAPDDPLNYFLGGCASGIFLGAKTHSAMTGTSACLGLGALALFTKVGKMDGWKISGPPEL